MEEIAISKFKATCLAVLERVRMTGAPVRVTRFGKPVAEIRPPTSTEKMAPRKLGFMRGTIEIVGDIVEPAIPEDEGEALSDDPATRYAYLDLGRGQSGAAASPGRKRARRSEK